MLIYKYRGGAFERDLNSPFLLAHITAPSPQRKGTSLDLMSA